MDSSMEMILETRNNTRMEILTAVGDRTNEIGDEDRIILLFYKYLRCEAGGL